MPKMHLTKTSVTNAEPKTERYDLFDTKLTGFGVRITPNGVKTFFVLYRVGDGGRSAKQRRLTLGKFGVLTTEEARELADSHLSSLRFDADPVTAKAKRRATIRVKELAERFLESHVNAKRKPTTAAHYADVLNRIVVPKFGGEKVDAVSRADLAQFHASLSDAPFQANRMLAIVGSMYSVGAQLGLVDEGFNPAKRIERFPEHARERYLTDKEIERLVDAIRLAETDGIPWQTNEASPGAKHLPTNIENRRTKLSPHGAAALRLLMFTGARLREILHLKWSEVDLQRGMLFLSDSKTGRKTIVLSGPAIEILAELERVGEFVIAGDDPKQPRKDLKRPWAAISKEAGLEGVRLHDLRHTFASIAAGKDFGLTIIGKLLGHTNPKTTLRYAHLADDPMKRATDVVGAAIKRAAGQPKSKAKPRIDGNVVAFRKR